MWNENSIAITDKVDAYGFVVKNLDSEMDKLKQLKKDLCEKIDIKSESISKNKERILNRLHFLIGDEPIIKGNLFKLKPIFRKERVVDTTKLEDRLLYQVVEIRLDCWKQLLNYIEETLPGPDVYFRCIGGPKYKVSELPEGHNAVETVLIPTCQIN